MDFRKKQRGDWKRAEKEKEPENERTKGEQKEDPLVAE